MHAPISAASRAREERAALVTQIGAVIDAADAAERDLTPGELNRIREAEQRCDELDKTIDSAEARAGLPATLKVGDERSLIGGGDSRDGRHIKRVLGPGDSLARNLPEHLRGEGAPIRPGYILAAMMTGRTVDLDDAELRALSLTPSTSGGFTASASTAARIIDLARAELAVFQAGAQTTIVEGESLTLPRLDTDFTAAWRGEGTAFNETTGEFGAVTLRPKSLAAISKISIELVEDSSVDLGNWVQQQLDAVLRAGLEDAILRGTGADAMPLGLENYPDVHTQSSGGSIADYEWLLTAMGDIWDANGVPNALIYGSTVAKAIAGLATGISGDKSPLRPPPATDSLQHYVSNHATDGTAYLADWSTVVVGFKPSSLRFQVLRERYADLGQIGVAADLRADIAVMHPEHVSITPGIS